MTDLMKTSEHSAEEQGNHHILSRREMEERLAEKQDGIEAYPSAVPAERQALEGMRRLAGWLEWTMLQIERPDCVGWDDDEADSNCPLFAQCSQRSELDDALCCRYEDVARAWLEGKDDGGGSDGRRYCHNC